MCFRPMCVHPFVDFKWLGIGVQFTAGMLEGKAYRYILYDT